MNEECPICLEYLDGVIVRLNCNHKYHQVCIEDWFNRTIANDNNLMCPECNLAGDISEIEYVNMKSEEVIELTKRYSRQHIIIDSDSDSDETDHPSTKKCSNFCVVS